MTTSTSPLRVLKAQADKIAQLLKAAERGEPIPGPFAEKIAAARSEPSLKVGVVMDDKFLSIEISWATIKATSEAGLSAYVLKQMQDQRESTH